MTDKQTIFLTWVAIFTVAFMGMVAVQPHLHTDVIEHIQEKHIESPYSIEFDGNDDYIDMNTNKFHGHNGTIDEIHLYMKPKFYEGLMQPSMKLMYINGSYRKVITQIKLNPEDKGWHYISVNPLNAVYFDDYTLVSNMNSAYNVHKCVYFVDGTQYTIIDNKTFMTAKWIDFGNETIIIDTYLGNACDRDRALMGFEIAHIMPQYVSEQNIYDNESKFIVGVPDLANLVSSTSIVLDSHGSDEWSESDKELLKQMMQVTAESALGIESELSFGELASVAPVHVLETYIDLLESAGY